MLKITSNKGFHLTFKNGVTASVQFGYGNHCDNYGDRILLEDGSLAASRNAEVAAWNEAGDMVHPLPDQDNEVIGHLSADDVLAFLNAASKL